jgi:hypothetical protein
MFLGGGGGATACFAISFALNCNLPFLDGAVMLSLFADFM